MDSKVNTNRHVIPQYSSAVTGFAGIRTRIVTRPSRLIPCNARWLTHESGSVTDGTLMRNLGTLEVIARTTTGHSEVHINRHVIPPQSHIQHRQAS